MSYKNYLLGGTALCGLLALGMPANAQSNAAFNSQIQTLQDQIRGLTQQLQSLQNQVQATQQTQAQTQRSVDQIKTQPAASSNGIIASMPNNRPTLSTADGQNTISLTGRFHFDAADYLSYTPQSSKVAPNGLNSGVNARRARIGVLGKVLGDWNYALVFDMGGTNDNTSTLENAYITYNGFRPLAIEGGYMDVPYTLDEATSSNDIMFVERASSQVIAANLAAGDNRSAAGVRWNNDRLWIGVYGTGPTSGSTHTFPQQFGAFGRASYQVLQDANYSFHVGVDAEGLIKPPTSSAVASTSSGFRAITIFSDRPELRVDPTQIVNAGTIGTSTNPVTGAAVYGFELAGGLGSAFAQAEYFHYNVARQGLSDVNFNGGYVQASYTLTGEARKYNPSTGAYSGIAPAHPFSLAAGTWGALEVAARYSIIDLNDQFTPGTTTASSNGIAGGQQQVFTFGLNWYPNTNIRFMLDYMHGIIDKKNGGSVSTALVPLGGGIGGTMDAIALRTQVAF